MFIYARHLYKQQILRFWTEDLRFTLHKKIIYNFEPYVIFDATNNKKPVHRMLTLDENVKIMAILDAVVKSSGSGKEEKIDG